MRHRSNQQPNSARPPMITPYSSKKSVPSLPHYQNAINDQAADNSDLLIISPIPLNKINRTPRAPPSIVRPNIAPSHSLFGKNQKKIKDKNMERFSNIGANNDLKEHSSNLKYSTQVQEIEDLLKKLIDKHPENEDYYRRHYSAFIRILNEASSTNPAKVPSIIRNTKMFFEGLLNGQIGRRGKIEVPNFDFEQKLRTIITKPASNSNSTKINSGRNFSNSRGNQASNSSENDQFENVFQDLFEENEKMSQHSGRFSHSGSARNTIDMSKLTQYENEIQEIKNLMQKLINKHPENEDYYQKHYETFLRVLNEAVCTNPAKAPVVIHNTKLFFEGLLMGLLGQNGRFERTNFDFEEKLRSVLDKPANNAMDDNVFQDIFDESKKLMKSGNANDEYDLSNLKQYEAEIKEIRGLVQKLIDRYTENKDYYNKHFETFLKILNEAVSTNPSKAPEVIQNTKLFFEGLLNGRIGTNGRINDNDFDFEKRLRSILSKKGNRNKNENVFQDLFDESNLKDYQNEINEIKDLMNSLIEKHPENEDYYRNLYRSFLKVLNDAVKTDPSKAPIIIRNTRQLFEGLLNDQLGTNGRIDDRNFDFEQKLRNILSGKDDGNNGFNETFNFNGTGQYKLPALGEDQENSEGGDESKISNRQDDDSALKQYQDDINEIGNIVLKLIEKHPENEDYYRNLFDSFMRVLREAAENDDPSTPQMVQAAKSIFENLLNGDNDKLDFDLEDRLRAILSNSNNNKDDGSGENEQSASTNDGIGEIRELLQKLIEKYPENENYYRKLFDAFLQVIQEATENNSPQVPQLINVTKMFFEELLNGDHAKLGSDIQDKLRDILSSFDGNFSSLNNENENKNSESNKDGNDDEDDDEVLPESLLPYKDGIAEIRKLMKNCTQKYPQNENYYRKLYDAFKQVIQEAAENNSPQVPQLINVTKLFFEELLNGDHAKLGFDIEDKLRNLLSGANENENENEAVNKYRDEIGEIENIVNGLIEKHPENKDYYKMLFDAFMRVLKEAAENDDPNAKDIINVAKSVFGDLLNGEKDKLDFDFEDRLRGVLSKGGKEGQSATDKYGEEIGEIESIVNGLIEKHPENKDYYKMLFDAFMRVLKEAAENDSPAANEIINVAKSVFGDLLNGEKDKLDFDLEDRLREVLNSDTLYKPYNEISNNDDYDDEKALEILREAGKLTTQNPRAKFEKLYPPPRDTQGNKRTTTVPNYQTIINALRFTLLQGPRFTKTIDSIISLMDQNKDERFLILMASRTLKFKGVYILSEDGLSATKLYGQGPNSVRNQDCTAYFKYLNGQKQFDGLEIRAFTQTTDAFALNKKLEPDSW